MPALACTVQPTCNESSSRSSGKAFARLGRGTAIGRKTHRQYSTPVLVFRHGRGFIIALTYGRQSQWVHNVLAEGGCQLETQGLRWAALSHSTGQ